MLHLEVLPEKFTVCKLKDTADIRLGEFCFLAGTDRELSLVCPTALVPERTAAREDGWRAFRIAGTLDFALTGILAGITSVLAGREIGVFAVSTFDTDYLLVRADNLERALTALEESGIADFSFLPGKDLL